MNADAQWWLWFALGLAIVTPALIGLLILHWRDKRFTVDESDQFGC